MQSNHPKDLVADDTKPISPESLSEALTDDNMSVSAFDELLKKSVLPKNFTLEDFMVLFNKVLDERGDMLKLGPIVRKASSFIKFDSIRPNDSAEVK